MPTYPFVKFADGHAIAYPTPDCRPGQALGSVLLTGPGTRALLRAARELRQLFRGPAARPRDPRPVPRACLIGRINTIVPAARRLLAAQQFRQNVIDHAQKGIAT